MPDATWKAAERRICRMLGGCRRGATGRDEADCVHDWLSVEIKTRKDTPVYIQDWMAQAEANAEDDKLPVVVWHGKGDRYDDALVVLRLGDFLDWFGDGEPNEWPHETERLPFDDWGKEE